jgi:autophagy-related protein 2
VTFVLDFGVPQISIEVDGIQLQARLIEEEKEVARPSFSGRTTPWKRSSSPPRSRDNLSDTSSDGDEHVPTVDELAKSFLRAEPTEEIRELEQELESRSEYLQESIAASDDGSDEGSAGMGAPLALPNYLRNILNTALDRLSIAVNNIDVEVEDHFPADTSDVQGSLQSSPASLNFHIERVSIDSVTTPDPQVEVGSTSSHDTNSNEGKRRMRVESICARLVSDAENFVSMSKISQPSSPILNRSEASTDLKAPSEPSSSQIATEPVVTADSVPLPEIEVQPTTLLDSTMSVSRASIASEREEANTATAPDSPDSPPSPVSPVQPRLLSSVYTVDEDRFADANLDEDLHEALENGSPSQSHHSLLNRDLGGSSILYDDDGFKIRRRFRCTIP